jgi:hypothetical protein
VQAVLGLLLAFGVELTTEQTGAILAITAAVLALFVRSQVTPTAGSPDPGEDGATDVVLMVAVAALVIAALAIFGIRLG